MSVTAIRGSYPIGSKVHVVGGSQNMTVLVRQPGSSFAYCVWADAGGEVRCEHFHDDDLVSSERADG